MDPTPKPAPDLDSLPPHLRDALRRMRAQRNADRAALICAEAADCVARFAEATSVEDLRGVVEDLARIAAALKDLGTPT